MLEFLRKILAFIFPVKCICCEKDLDTPYLRICQSCFEREKANVQNRCKKCSTPIDAVYGDMLCPRCRKKRYFDKVLSPFAYKGKIKSALVKYKFHRAKSYARTFASCMLLELNSFDDIYNDIDVISFIPLHPVRLGERGYNQSELIAEYLSEMTGRPLMKSLRCTRYSKPLSSQKHKNRKKLVKGLFEVLKPSDIKGLNILLVDDIITTGATISECSRILKRAGAKKVYGIAVAATPKY